MSALLARVPVVVAALLALRCGGPQGPSLRGSRPDAAGRPTRQPVRGGVARAIDLPGVAILAAGAAVEGVPATTPADPTVRSRGLPAPSGAREVEVVIESSALGQLRIGDQTVWHHSGDGARAPIHALCNPTGAGLGFATVSARWLTARPSDTLPEGIDVRLGQGAFDGTRCELLASSGGAITARALEPTVPVYAFRTCEPSCRDATGSAILILPKVDSLVMDATDGALEPDAAAAGIRQAPFTLVEVPLSPSGTISLLARVRGSEAIAFRKELGLRGKGSRGDVDVAIEVTRSESDASALVGVFVSRGLALPEVEVDGISF